MLSVGRSRMDNEGQVGGLDWLQVNAEALPFADSSFNHVTITFGLRNVTWRDQALAEMHRVLKPGGRVPHHGVFQGRTAGAGQDL